ncbi:MAG: EamA family transporter, partial [Flavobacteriaceae bacterium]
QTFYAIIINYMVACTTGLLLFNQRLSLNEMVQKPYFWGSALLGVLFISIFYLMAITAQKAGVSVVSVATKMSLVVPVVFGLFYFNEALGPYKAIGVLLALAAVYFSAMKQNGIKVRPRTFLLPIGVFLGSGIIDASINFFRETRVPESEFPLFSALTFAFAALSGILFIGVRSVKVPLRPNLRNVLGGIILGIPNFFSIYFLLKALGNNHLNSASVFTINNVAIVLFSTLLGITLFKERMTPRNWLGLGLAVASIVLVALF